MHVQPVEWKEIAGFEKYSISNNAQIKNNDSNKILKQNLNKSTGYMQVSVKPNGRAGKSKLFRVHREFALAWIPNPDNKPVINHKDCNKTNNSIENLEWVTHQENVVHAFDNDLIVTKYGVDTNFAILNDDLVRLIRSDRMTSRLSLRKLAPRYGVAHNTLSDILTGKTWKHVV